MERASKIIGSSRLAKRICTQQDLAQATWRAAVGKRLAAHTNPSFLRGAVLTVEVADEVWEAQLEPLLPHILQKMAAIAGGHLVTEIALAVVPRRRSMAVERNAGAGRQGRLVLEDAREHVEDPVLARIYASARRRAMAG